MIASLHHRPFLRVSFCNRKYLKGKSILDRFDLLKRATNNWCETLLVWNDFITLIHICVTGRRQFIETCFYCLFLSFYHLFPPVPLKYTGYLEFNQCCWSNVMFIFLFLGDVAFTFSCIVFKMIFFQLNDIEGWNSLLPHCRNQMLSMKVNYSRPP